MWREHQIDQIEDDPASPPAALVVALLEEDPQADAAIIHQLNAFYARYNPAKDGKAERVLIGVKKQYRGTAARELEKSLMNKYAVMCVRVRVRVCANVTDRMQPQHVRKHD